MKITERQLRGLIKESIKKVLKKRDDYNLFGNDMGDFEDYRYNRGYVDMEDEENNNYGFDNRGGLEQNEMLDDIEEMITMNSITPKYDNNYKHYVYEMEFPQPIRTRNGIVKGASVDVNGNIELFVENSDGMGSKPVDISYFADELEHIHDEIMDM